MLTNNCSNTTTRDHRSSQTRHRLKQSELVTKLFYLFSEVFEESDCDSIWDLSIPIGQVKNILEEKYDIHYKSGNWIFIQLKRYEDEHGVVLFQKEKRGTENECALKLHRNMVTFFQKQHLYLSEKIRVANGVYDKLRDFSSRVGRPITILMGAGSVLYHLAEILARESWNTSNRIIIYTHNLGSLNQLVGPKVNGEIIQVFTPPGRVDPTTYTIVGNDTSFFRDIPFDFVIQGTSYLHNGSLYIESSEERDRKADILKECSGEKILLLTKHELVDDPPDGLEHYGFLMDYDVIIVPRTRVEVQGKKSDRLFKQYLNRLSVEILNWNYCIYRVTEKDKNLTVLS